MLVQIKHKEGISYHHLEGEDFIDANIIINIRDSISGNIIPVSKTIIIKAIQGGVSIDLSNKLVGITEV